jgi:hypothetical protein
MNPQTFEALENLKQTLSSFSDEQLKNYIAKLSRARESGAARVKRSSLTGAPTGGRSMSPQQKFDKLFGELTEEQKAALLAELTVQPNEPQ